MNVHSLIESGAGLPIKKINTPLVPSEWHKIYCLFLDNKREWFLTLSCVYFHMFFWTMPSSHRTESMYFSINLLISSLPLTTSSCLESSSILSDKLSSSLTMFFTFYEFELSHLSKFVFFKVWSLFSFKSCDLLFQIFNAYLVRLLRFNLAIFFFDKS